MKPANQEQIVFYLTGRRVATSLRPIDSRFRPALFARFSDLSTIRHDFPLVLNHKGPADRAIVSLTRLVDKAIDAFADDPDRDRLARHGYRMETEIRRSLACVQARQEFTSVWNAAAARLAGEDEIVVESAKRLWNEFDVDGEIVDVDRALPAKVLWHVWSRVQANKAAEFRRKTERLLKKLRDILSAEMSSSEVGRAPEHLKASVGAGFAEAFDFERLSRTLIQAKPGIELSRTRRERIIKLIETLEDQRFFSLEAEDDQCYEFAFERCSEALAAYRERRVKAIELLKALAVAELEANGDYIESVHDAIFDGFGANGLGTAELSKLPEYLICLNSENLDPNESELVTELLAAGLPFRILVQVDDVLTYSATETEQFSLNSPSHRLANAAIGLGDVFVYQSAASQLCNNFASVVRGLTYDGPSLFSIFSGAGLHTLQFQPYLVAAAAAESRVFPTLVYDPSAGPDWASRLSIGHNPAKDQDWPVHSFAYEDSDFQNLEEDLSFTPADFLAMDDRSFKHFSIVPEDHWNEKMLSVPEALQAEFSEIPENTPSIVLIDETGQLHRAILDDRILSATRRCLTTWKSLQELGGINNSYVEQALKLARESRSGTDIPPQEMPVAASESSVASTVSKHDDAEEPVVETISSDDPYIETARCTTCNECTGVNSRMFAYNENKQAYIADASAGTFRELVEAAEGCQVSIIHPGKPRDPNEPGLEDLITRAAEFN